MIKFYSGLLSCAALFLFSCQCLAQTSPTDMGSNTTKNDNQPSFRIGVSYLSNNVFMGRSDTVRTPTFIPTAKYSFANGIYVSGSLYYITNRKKDKVDGGDLSAGYDFDITDDLTGSASYTKQFYNSNSTEIGSSISSTFNGTLSYDIGTIITPTVGADFNLNRQGYGSDVFVNAGITHDFAAEGIFGEKDIFIASPTAAVNAGTQNFFDAYLTNKKFKNAKKTTAQNKLSTAQKQDLSQFKLLDYEFSVPLEYKAGVFIFTFTPTYTVAENKLPASVSSKLSTESGLFYFQTGVTLKF